MITINDSKLVLDDFWDMWFTNCRFRYRVMKGARKTGKTFQFIRLEPIFKILSDSRRNIMFIRANYKDNGTSTFTGIKKQINIMGLSHLFKCTTCPYKITRVDTGQVILFCGMNDVESITGTEVESGYWTDIYFEEASQLKSYEDFRVVDGSIRIPENEDTEGLFIQITFLLNGWDVGHWICDVFFKDNLKDDIDTLENHRYMCKMIPDFNLGYGKGLGLHISSYRTNPYRNSTDDEDAEALKKKAYSIYLVEKLGCWGNTGDSPYEYLLDSNVISDSEVKKIRYADIAIGIDTGLSNGEGKILKNGDKSYKAAMTMQMTGISSDYSTIVAMDEYFDSNAGRTIENKKKELEYCKEMCETICNWINEYELEDYEIDVYVDSADTGYRDNMETIAENYDMLENVRFYGSTKIEIQKRVRFTNLCDSMGEMKYSEKCKNLLREKRNSKKGENGKIRADGDDHAINAWEYGWIPNRQRVRRWGSFKDI